MHIQANHAQFTAMVENYLLGATNEAEVLTALDDVLDPSAVVTDALTVVALQYREYPATVTPRLRKLFEHFHERLDQIDIFTISNDVHSDRPRKLVELIMVVDMLEALIPQVSDRAMTATFAPVVV